MSLVHHTKIVFWYNWLKTKRYWTWCQRHWREASRGGDENDVNFWTTTTSTREWVLKWKGIRNDKKQGPRSKLQNSFKWPNRFGFAVWVRVYYDVFVHKPQKSKSPEKEDGCKYSKPSRIYIYTSSLSFICFCLFTVNVLMSL